MADLSCASPELPATWTSGVYPAVLPFALPGPHMALLPGMLMLRPPPPGGSRGITCPLAAASEGTPKKCWVKCSPRPKLLGECPKEVDVLPGWGT